MKTLNRADSAEMVATLKECISSAHNALVTLPVTLKERKDLERYIRRCEQSLADIERQQDAEKKAGR